MKNYISLKQFKSILAQASFTEQEIEYITTTGLNSLEGNKKGYYIGSKFEFLENEIKEIKDIVLRDGSAVERKNADDVLKSMIRRAKSIREKVISSFDAYQDKYLAGFTYDMSKEQIVERMEAIGVSRNGYKISKSGFLTVTTLDAWYTIHMIAKAEQKKIDAAKKRKEAIRQKHDKEINNLTDNFNWHSTWSYSNAIKTGSNFDGVQLSYGKQNSVSIDEYTEWKQYTKRQSWPVTHRTLNVSLRKGWRIRKVGGIVTFYKGKFDRQGMAVEWVEQGRAIADIRIVKGYLVRGEHIEAKSLEEAKRINADHRADILANTIEARRKTVYYREHEDELVVTFNDSLNSGNCRPGTMNFKNQYEEAIGREANSITVGELRKYAKKFGCTYYAERAIKYALNHIK